MVSGSVRRLTTPQTVQQIWASVQYIRHQKQISNTERIVRYMQRTYEMSQSEASTHLQNTVKDRLIDRYTYIGSKGTKVGIEQEGFKVPEVSEEWDRGNHDWYCFECHKPGEVLTCSDCWRVYHAACLPEELIGNKFTCAICKVMRKKQRIKRKELNRLLSYTVNRLKEKTRELHRLFTTEEEQKFAQFIFLSMDLNTMEAKTKNRKYRYIEQFQADAQTIYHNVLLCYGPGTMAELAKIMIRDCKYDLDEIRQCKDCYNYSNAKPSNWFCKPCRPAHELVYAKQKGFSFWPAKVIKKTSEGYDVRFFGGWHQRAVVAAVSVKPIDTNLRALNIKRTSGFSKACEELKRHQKLLEQQQETDDEEDNDNDNDTTVNDMEEEGEEREEEDAPKAKRFKEEQEVISSSNVVPDKPAPTPEDANLVTSSEDNIQTPRIISTVDMGTQTSKKLSHPGRQPHKGTQTDLEVATTSCKCEAKYNKIFNDFKERMENDHREDKDRGLKELTERLQKDFEEDKQQAVARAMANMQREVDRVKRQSEDRVKEQYMEELKKLAAKHKSDISQTKKKQWCYNCEEEAMYHCCWNTSYCSIKCQQEHWHREHKRCCRRKR